MPRGVAQLVEHYTVDWSIASSGLTRVTVLCHWARHFIHCLVLVKPRKTGNSPSKYDWKIVDWEVKHRNKQTSHYLVGARLLHFGLSLYLCSYFVYVSSEGSGKTVGYPGPSWIMFIVCYIDVVFVCFLTLQVHQQFTAKDIFKFYC